MYSGSGFSDWEIGDITVIKHKGVYHLFHLIIPNHDYIAHAISNDGISWKRVNNALFVGHPGEWDDDMLWTMHVIEKSKDGKPYFLMYYTGLQRKDRGVVSRIGFAESEDLVEWKKINTGAFPIEPKGVYYETSTSNPRTWLSFRDPFYYKHQGEEYILVCGRTIHGPVSRRGCVGVVKIIDNKAELLKPLLYPMVYDDVECPCAFQLNGKNYLIGSIREDIKVRYWFAPEFFGEYHSFHDDVLLPQGNYAARTVEDGEHLLVYNFFYAYGKIDALRVLPPPKQLDTDESGQLLLKSYYKWNTMVIHSTLLQNIGNVKALLGNPHASASFDNEKFICTSKSGYEIFAFENSAEHYIWEGTLTVEGMGKLGLVSDIDEEGNGYFFSFDMQNGLVQVRAWGFDPHNNRHNFIFNDLQSSVFEVSQKKILFFSLIRYGHYIELSIDGIVKLTLMDYTYTGRRIGIYSASSVISLQQSTIKVLPEPRTEYASQEEAQRLPGID